MCVIIDVTMYHHYLEKENKQMKPLRNWIENGSGRIAYSSYEKFDRELKGKSKGNSRMHTQMTAYRKSGLVKVIDKKNVASKVKELENKELKSDDVHILAIALAGNIRLLTTKDGDLQQDFRKFIGKGRLRGKVYQYSNHTHLLTQDRCP